MQRYYKQIHDMPPLSEQEMNAHLAEESRVRAAGRRVGVSRRAPRGCATAKSASPALLRGLREPGSTGTQAAIRYA